MSNTHAIMEVLSKLPAGQNFTAPELKRSLKTPLQYWKVSNALTYLTTRGVVKKVTTGSFGRTDGKNPVPITYELINPNYIGMRVHHSLNGTKHKTYPKKAISSKASVSVHAIIADIQQKLKLLESTSGGKSLKDYSTQELFAEIGSRTK